MIELIIEDYVASLKEKDELDVLFPNLLKLEGYLVKSLPKTGERQYGVDLLAEKDDEVFLYVIKQGNLTRTNWNSGENSVRQSIEEVFDVYLNLMLDPCHEKSKKHIVFVTNGMISDAVRPNWERYKKNKSTENITITSVLLPDLVRTIVKQGFNETLFNKEKSSDLRKCLYYLDESDYKLIFFENIIDQYFQEIIDTKTDKQRHRLFSSLQMMLGLVNHSAIEKKRYRISIEFSEYVIVSMWQYLGKNEEFENAKIMEWLNNFIKIYIHSNENFIDNLVRFSTSRGGLPSYNPIEYRTLCFDVLGRLSLYGIFLSTTDALKYFKLSYSTKDVMYLLISLMNNNYGFYYPVYDNDGIELSLLFYFVLLEKGKEEVEVLVREYMGHIFANIRNNKYPILERRYSLAMEVEFGEIDYSERYSASFLWGIIYEWAILIDKQDIYNQILDFDFLDNVSIQNWNLLSEEESRFYNKFEVHGEGYTDILNDCEPDEAKKIILEAKKIENFKKFSFIEFSFPIVGLLVSKKNRIPVIPSYWRREFIE